MQKFHFEQQFSDYYLFGSRLLTHIVFWLAYYVSFSLIWVNDLGLTASFYLEFVLLPVRVMATYSMMYWLLPNLLLQKRYLAFLAYYSGLLLVCAVLQRLSIYFFYEELLLRSNTTLLHLPSVFRAGLLINTTVLLGAFIKLIGLYHVEQSRLPGQHNPAINIKSNRRTYLINVDDVLYIEGLGNYINYYLQDGRKLTVYDSIKNAVQELPEFFVRVHKSYVVNRKHIASFNAEDIQIRETTIPRGKSVADDQLLSPRG